MPVHDVTMTIPPRKLERAKLEFAVKIDDVPHGKLKVSNGSIIWSEGQKQYGYRMDWTTFAKLMIENGEPEK